MKMETAPDGVMDSLESLATHTRGRRLVLGLSQTDVAQRARLSIETVRALEREPHRTSVGALFRVLHVLGIDSTVANAGDPLRTDLGIARAGMLSRKRAPRRARR